MTRAIRVVVQLACALALFFCAQGAQAQSTEPPPGAAVTQPAVEVTPFVGLGSPGSARAGAAVAFVWTPKVRIESEFAYHPRALFSSSINLVYSLPHVKAVEPYVTAGIGLGQNETALQAPAPVGLVIQRSVGLIVNAGTGFTVPVREGVGYRFDARWSNPLGIQPESWRIYQGGTFGIGK